MTKHMKDEVEQRALKKIEDKLYALDFSGDSDMDRVKENVFKDLKRNRGMIMNTNRHINIKKKIAAVSVAVLAGAALMQTTFAQDLVEKVVKTINLGHIQIAQYDAPDVKIPVPETLKGKLFTKDGKEITEVTKDMKDFYTKDGQKIDQMDAETGEIALQGQQLKREETDDELIVRDQSKLNEYTCFEVKLPQYLPEGYTFDRAEFFKDDNGKVEKTKYISIYFKNQKSGNELYLDERFADKETAYETGTDGKIEEVKIGNAKAVLQDDKNLYWEADGNLFGYSTRGKISKEELIKSAESIK